MAAEGTETSPIICELYIMYVYKELCTQAKQLYEILCYEMSNERPAMYNQNTK